VFHGIAAVSKIEAFDAPISRKRGCMIPATSERVSYLFNDILSCHDIYTHQIHTLKWRLHDPAVTGVNSEARYTQTGVVTELGVLASIFSKRPLGCGSSDGFEMAVDALISGSTDANAMSVTEPHAALRGS
jgi:hypothetical protein